MVEYLINLESSKLVVWVCKRVEKLSAQATTNKLLDGHKDMAS